MRALGLLLVVLASCGKTQPPPPIAWRQGIVAVDAAQAAGQPVLVFVDADWDQSRQEYERTTFADPEVRGLLRDVVTVYIDCGDDEREPCMGAQRRLRIVGLPTVLLFDPDGTERLRINEYMPPAQFAETLRKRKH